MKSKIKSIAILACAFAICGCSGSNCTSFDDCVNADSKGEWQRIEYAGKQSTTAFSDGNWGEHFYYFPAFGRTSGGRKGLDTDGDTTIIVNRDFEDLVHFDDVSKRNIGKLDNRTFSFDDYTDKNEVGTKTAGGYEWPKFFLPEDKQGRYLEGQSGVVYDPATRDNSNNIVNQIIVKSEELRAFCLNIVTDNTYGQYDPDVTITARGDLDDADATVPKIYHTFDEITDVYTFKYTGFQKGDKIKIRIKASSSKVDGGGFGGLMVSKIDTCCNLSCNVENECGGENGCGGLCGCDKGEQQVAILVPSQADSSHITEVAQEYYLRGLYTRQVLTIDPINNSLTVEPRKNLENQRWIFSGSCDSETRCEGHLISKRTKECLAMEGRKIEFEPPPCSGDKSKWVFRSQGGDRVINEDEGPFTNATKYSIRNKHSSNDYLVARATGKSARDAAIALEQDLNELDVRKLEMLAELEFVSVENRSDPDRPWDHWIFEYALPEDQPSPE